MTDDPRAAPTPEASAPDLNDNVTNEFRALSKSAAASFLAFEDSLPDNAAPAREAGTAPGAPRCANCGHSAELHRPGTDGQIVCYGVASDEDGEFCCDCRPNKSVAPASRAAEQDLADIGYALDLTDRKTVAHGNARAAVASLRATVAALTDQMAYPTRVLTYAERVELARLNHVLTGAPDGAPGSPSIAALLGAATALAARLHDAERDRDALREVVQDFAIVGRHTETRAHGSSDQYRMPAGSSWFDSREAAVTDFLAARAAPRGDAAPDLSWVAGLDFPDHP